MKRLRFWIAILSIWLVFFFNIERILFYKVSAANIIRSETYIFVAIIALVGLLLPRLHILSFSGLLVIITSLFLFLWYRDPKWGISVSAHFTHPYAITLLTIIQVNAIFLTGLLVRQITYSLSEFEDTIAKITIGHIGRRPSPFSEEQSAMYRELKRARHYERPLSVLALKIDEETIQGALPAIVKQVQQGMMKEYALASIAGILDDNLQGFDTIALWDDNFVLLLPETPARQASLMAQSLEKTINEKLKIQAKIGIASFPDQAITFESLVELARSNADQQATTTPFTIEQNRQSLTQEA